MFTSARNAAVVTASTVALSAASDSDSSQLRRHPRRDGRAPKRRKTEDR